MCGVEDKHFCRVVRSRRNLEQVFYWSGQRSGVVNLGQDKSTCEECEERSFACDWLGLKSVSWTVGSTKPRTPCCPHYCALMILDRTQV